MKVMTIVGTRPEIIKLSSTLKELDKYTEHILVHTGQNYDYELNEVFFKGVLRVSRSFFKRVSKARGSLHERAASEVIRPCQVDTGNIQSNSTAPCPGGQGAFAIRRLNGA